MKSKSILDKSSGNPYLKLLDNQDINNKSNHD